MADQVLQMNTTMQKDAKAAMAQEASSYMQTDRSRHLARTILSAGDDEKGPLDEKKKEWA